MPTYQENPFWRLQVAGGITGLLKDIPLYFQNVLKYSKEPEHQELIQGFRNEYTLRYISECKRREKTGTQALEETQKALLNTEDPETREKMKTQNLSKAISYLFGESIVVENPAYECVNVDLAKTLNRFIGENLFSGAGDFRTSDAKSSGSDFTFVSPNKIPECMDCLFEKLNHSMKSINDNNWYEIASKFFIEFLDIHPFRNGNGRTARLLLSYVLCKYTLVPVSLFSPVKDCNEHYLRCVTEASWFNNYELINALIIESCHRTLHMFLTTFDLIGHALPR